MGCAAARRNITVTSAINVKKDKKTDSQKGEIIKEKESELSRSNFANETNICPSMINIDSHGRKAKFESMLGISERTGTKSKTQKFMSNIDRKNTKKLTEEIEKVEDFEKRMNSRRSSKMVKVESTQKNNFSMFSKILEEEIGKEKETLIVEEYKENSGDVSPVSPDVSQDNMKEKIKEDNTIVIYKIPEESEDSKGEEFFKESPNVFSGSLIDNYRINVVNVANPESRESKVNQVITGLNTNKKEGRLNSNFYNTIETYKQREKKPSCFTDLGSNTIDYSSIDEGDKSPSAYSPTKVLRKYNLNPYHNFNVVKKYFIYQLKKSFLQAKKMMINNKIYRTARGETPSNTNTKYHEIFSNYSQISTTTVNSYIKYEDSNVMINNYYIKKNKVLGKGGFSTVYLCKNLQDGQEYAVKITDKNTKANPKRKKYDYVKDEVNILKRLYSRYIVKTYEIMETKSECLIVMELMNKNSLYSKIRDLDDYRIWKYFRNMICGVEHCHEIGKIIHRDINVNNMLISDDDILKLSDFGVSLIMEDEDDLIPVNSGPTTYTPPEKKYNENSHYNGKPADVWCCGVALYHMVYKYPLFKNYGTLTRIDYNVSLPEDPEIDPVLKSLLLKLLDENPNNRPTFNDMKKNNWITKNGEFPLPDIHEEALEYVYSLTSQEIKGMNEERMATNNDELSPSN